MPNPVFQGLLRISLVSIHVKAYSATVAGSGQISFNQLHDKCHSRIQYKKICPIHGQVTQSDIVSGYEYEKGKYVVFDPGEVEQLRSEKDHSIDITQFVNLDQVDPLYESGKDYFIVPDGTSSEKSYQLIQQAMQTAGVCGISQVVISRREELVMVRPLKRMLLMTVLRYANELKAPEDFLGDMRPAKPNQQELNLTTQLIKALTVKAFDASAFHDVYEEKLRELIDAKIEGRQVVAPRAEREVPKVINLMDAIRKSMKQVKTVKSDSRPIRAAARRKKSG